MAFIPGLCRIWARRTNQPYWVALTYSPRGYHECEALVNHYEEEWGSHYDYVITADSNLCRPKPVAAKSYVATC